MARPGALDAATVRLPRLTLPGWPTDQQCRGRESGGVGLPSRTGRSGSAHQADIHTVSETSARPCSSPQALRNPPEATANSPAPRRQPVYSPVHRGHPSRHVRVPEPEFAAQQGDNRVNNKTRIPAVPRAPHHRLDQPQPPAGMPQQQRPCISSQPRPREDRHSVPANVSRDRRSVACLWIAPDWREALPKTLFASVYRPIQITASLPARPR